jgi:hypothetical protein
MGIVCQMAQFWSQNAFTVLESDVHNTASNSVDHQERNGDSQDTYQ